MAVDLRRKREDLQKIEGESLEFGKGYIISTRDRRCSILQSAHTTLLRTGLLRHQPPCVRFDLQLVEGEDIGTGSKDELLQAVKDGRISTDNPQLLTDAVSSGRVLYLPRAKGLLVITRKEGLPEQLLDNHAFYTAEERAAAAKHAVEQMRSSTRTILGFSKIDRKDADAVAAFLELQLP